MFVRHWWGSVCTNLEFGAAFEVDIFDVLRMHQFDLFLCVSGWTILCLMDAVLHNINTHVVSYGPAEFTAVFPLSETMCECEVVGWAE